MEQVNITNSSTTLSDALTTSLNKSLRKGKKKTRKHAKGSSKTTVPPKEAPNLLKSAWGFLSGLYAQAQANKETIPSPPPTAVHVLRNEFDLNGNLLTPVEIPTPELKKASVCETVSNTKVELGARQTSFPILRRPSNLLPRQNSSGMNVILDNLPVQDCSAHEIHTGKTHIRNSYEAPKPQPPSPLRLSNIFHNRIQSDSFGHGSNLPRILNKAFFDSVNEHIRKIKSQTSNSVQIQSNNGNEEMNENKDLSSATSQTHAISNDTAGNVNINLTLQLGDKTGSTTIGDINQNRTVIIDARQPNSKPETCVQSVDTTSEIWRVSEQENTVTTNSSVSTSMADFLTTTDVNGNLRGVPPETSGNSKFYSKAMEYTGNSLKAALTLLVNIIPADSVAFTEEEMNLNEGHIAVTIMRMLGVPQEMRHQIYQEICGEVEVLQDVSTGTFDALSTVLKCIIGGGGTPERETILQKTRALCAMNSEVDMNSEVWYRLQQTVAEITDAVENAVQEGVEKAQIASKRCSDTFVELVASATSSAASSRHDLSMEREKSVVVLNLGSILEEDDMSSIQLPMDYENNNVYNYEEPIKSIMDPIRDQTRKNHCEVLHTKSHPQQQEFVNAAGQLRSTRRCCSHGHTEPELVETKIPQFTRRVSFHDQIQQIESEPFMDMESEFSHPMGQVSFHDQIQQIESEAEFLEAGTQLSGFASFQNKIQQFQNESKFMEAEAKFSHLARLHDKIQQFQNEPEFIEAGTQPSRRVSFHEPIQAEFYVADKAPLQVTRRDSVHRQTSPHLLEGKKLFQAQTEQEQKRNRAPTTQIPYQMDPHVFRQQLLKPSAYFGASDSSLPAKRATRTEDTLNEHIFSENKQEEGDYCLKSSWGIELEKLQKISGLKTSFDENNNLVPQEHTIRRCELSSKFPEEIGNVSKWSYGKADLSVNGKDEKTFPIVNRTSSDCLVKLPRAPPNSEVLFDSMKHQEKVLRDLYQLEKLVQDLYETLTPPTSKTQLKETTTMSKLNQPPIISSGGGGGVQRTPSSQKIKTSRIPVRNTLTSLARTSSIFDARSSKSSTVSLYNSRRGTESNKSIMAVDNPMRYSKKETTQVDQNNNRVVKSMDSCQSLNPSQTSLQKICENSAKAYRRKLASYSQQDSIFTKTSAASTTEPPSRTSSPMELDSRTSSMNLSHSFLNPSSMNCMRSVSATKPPNREKTFVSSSAKPKVSRSRAFSRQSSTLSTASGGYQKATAPASYQELLLKQKEYKSIAQKYMHSISSATTSSRSSSKSTVSSAPAKPQTFRF